MRHILFAVLVVAAAWTNAQTKSTVSDGSWFDPAIWSPAGVPLNEDSVIIQHDVTVYGNYVDFGATWLLVQNNASIISDTTFSLHGNLRNRGVMTAKIIAIGDGDSTINLGSVDGGKYVPGNPSNLNFGFVISDSLICGDDFINEGQIDVLTLIVGDVPFTNKSYAAIQVAGMALLSGTIINESNATMVLGDLTTEGTMTNNGDITCTNWTHASGTATGTGGKFCVSTCFVNTADITGTIDICDSSPAGFCDMDFGTIAGTVTNCASGSCIDNTALTEHAVPFVVYPNPACDIVFIQGESSFQYAIFSLDGKKIMSGSQASNGSIYLTELTEGAYILMLSGSNTQTQIRLIKQ